MQTIAVIRETTHLTDMQVAAYVAAQNTQLQRDFAPIWNTVAKIIQVTSLKSLAGTEWPLYLRDHTGADDLGNHAVTSNTPYGVIGVADCALDGSSWTVDASHEVLEMLIDPLVTTYCVASDGWTYTKEVCDAVQDDRYGYRIDGVLMSAFVRPAWFDLTTQQHECVIFPNNVSVSCPFQLGKGGYIQRIKPGDPSWSMVTPLGERLTRRQTKDQNPSSRAARRLV